MPRIGGIFLGRQSRWIVIAFRRRIHNGKAVRWHQHLIASAPNHTPVITLLTSDPILWRSLQNPEDWF